MRRHWSRWGLPGAYRVDNGYPWCSTGGLPTAFALWLLGLGLRMLWNHPHCPEENGCIERSMGTTKRWVGPARRGDIDEFRRSVAREDYVQREVFPSIGGLSRRAAFPGLLHSGRGYAEGIEEHLWDIEPVWRWLGGCQVRRKVAPSGKISVYDWGRLVGKEHSGQQVWLGLDAQAQEWVVTSQAGAELCRLPALEISRANILNLCVSRPRGH